MGSSKTLRSLAIVGLVLVVAACAGPGKGRPRPPSTLQGAGLPAAAAQQAVTETPLGRSILRVVNQQRTGPSLNIDATLQRAASVHAKDMALRNFQGHHSPEGLGPNERVLAVDADFQGRVAENIWIGTALPGKSDDQMATFIVEQWSNSPRHRNNFESSTYSRTGLGIARKGSVIYAVQVFAK